MSTKSGMTSDSGIDPRPMEKLGSMSTDASIKTWLHKIKQNPFEEDDEYDFVEEMSGIWLSASVLLLTKTANKGSSLNQCQ